MSYKTDSISEIGLQFFGKISSSNFHEIKNVLAIINETAGLLEDFSLMAEQGVPVGPERMKDLSSKIMKQVRRADGIVRSINRFSHSVDKPTDQVDIAEFLTFMIGLSERFAAMQGVTLKAQPSDIPLLITTAPFLLENFVWLCLDFAMKVAGAGKTVGLAAEKAENNGVRIRFTNLDGLTESLISTFPKEREKALPDALQAEITTDIGAKEMILRLPGDITVNSNQ